MSSQYYYLSLCCIQNRCQNNPAQEGLGGKRQYNVKELSLLLHIRV